MKEVNNRKIVVAGSRDIEDDAFVEEKLLAFIGGDKGNIEIVHGDCPTGVDQSADRVAKKYGWKIKKFPADWHIHGKAAGPIRNFPINHHTMTPTQLEKELLPRRYEAVKKITKLLNQRHSARIKELEKENTRLNKKIDRLSKNT